MTNIHDPQIGTIQNLGMVPMVVEQSARGERAYDIYSRLLKGPYRVPRGSCGGPYGEFDCRPIVVFGV